MTTAVKERPILFSGPMVRAIMDGRKTQTRRIVKPQPPCACVYEINGNQNKAICLAGPGADVPARPWFVPPYVNKAQYWVCCPYGTVGDRLWIRETWRPIVSGTREGGFDYRANDPSASGVGFTKWTPSIHMPRLASRITLEITSVRVERLNDISAEDAKAEGIMFGTGKPGQCRTCAKGAFMDLWNSINGVDSWLQNPWVWVVEFKRVKP